MGFTTFLFGAGASANAIPTIKELPNAFLKVSDYISEEIKKHKLGEGKNFNTLDYTEINNLSISIRKLAEVSNEYGTVDTYFKKLYLNKEEEEIRILKIALSFFFYVWQNCNTNIAKTNGDKWLPIDLRYIALLATILKEKDGKPVWNENFKIITWNYDFQIISALLKFSSIDDASLISDFSIFPFNNILNNSSEANIVYLNGVSGAYDFKNCIDFRFKENYCNTIENISELYDDFKSSNTQTKEYVNFAWDFHNNDISKLTVLKARDIMKSTSKLVIIGYSFPYFNYEVDSLLFSNLSEDATIVYQDFDAEVESIVSRFGRTISTSRTKIINSSKMMNQFHIPQI